MNSPRTRHSQVTVICANYIGYKRGHADAECERIPFDLGIYLQLYDMRKFLPTNEAICVASEQSVRLLIYGKLAVLKKNRERVKKISANRNDFLFDQDMFEQRVERAKRIVEGIEDEMVPLRDVFPQEAETSHAITDLDETTAP